MWHHQHKNQYQAAHKTVLNMNTYYKYKLIKIAHLVNVLMEKFYVPHCKVVMLLTKTFKKHSKMVVLMLEVFMNILTLFAMTVMLALVSMELYLAQVIHFYLSALPRKDGFHIKNCVSRILYIAFIYSLSKNE